MTQRNWIGAAVGLALCSTALVSCSGGSKSDQSKSQEAAAALQWTHAAEKQMLDAIANAPANGLKPELFLKGDLPKDDAERAKVLTGAALRYAEALAHGYADPTKLTKDYTIPRPNVDVRQGLAQAIRNGNVGEWLASLPPQTDEYRELSQAQMKYLALAGAAKGAQVPGGKPIRPGQRDPRVPQLSAALIANAYLPAPGGPNAQQSYSGAMVAAVRRMQGDYGLKPDGVITADTLMILNAGAGYRARQIAVALERLRWLERTPPATRIDVNTAASFLDYWRGGAHVIQLRVINGQPDESATPQIQSPLFQLVANPNWRVPDRILKDELSKKSAAYLAENDFTWRDGRLIQLPGDKNSLGQVKFDMRDPQQIYLHDTPFKSWFATDNRHRSHGCVRVQDAVNFAFQLASEDGVQDKFQEALASGEESYVKLRREIPVRLFYHTAYWDGTRLVFVSDIYGWDDNVARALGLEPGPPRAAFHRQEDVGP